MVICVVGLGYVGLPLALAFSKKGIKVIGYDTSLKRKKELKFITTKENIDFPHQHLENRSVVLKTLKKN